MVAYQIAELSPDAAGGFAPRGAVRELWTSRDTPVIIDGPAETGKTYGCLHYLDALLWKYPDSRALMARKTYASLLGSAVETYWDKVQPRDTPVVRFGGERVQFFAYPNGSRLWCGGMDTPGKVLSSERDFIYVNQVEELSVDDWEYLIGRATGRAGNTPYARIIGDCNPGPPQHWIKRHAAEGRLRLDQQLHRHNPVLYDNDGALTAQGVETMRLLGSYTGIRRDRLYRGLWVSAEGTVYELTDAHLGDDLFQPDKPTQLAVDPSNGSGPYAALVLQQVGARVLVVGEFYLVGGKDEDLRDWLKASPYYAKLTTVISDPAKPDTIWRLAKKDFLGIPVRAKQGKKDITAQISAVKSLMELDPVTKVAPLVIDRGRCPMLLDEFSQYVWQKPMTSAPDRNISDTPVDAHNHCLDALAYWVTTKALAGSREHVKREPAKPVVPWYAQPSGARR